MVSDTHRPGEVVIQKSLASAFAGTQMLRHLVQLKVDQVIIVGNSTSGCVRATAIDAQQQGFAVCVPEDAVFDRIQVITACCVESPFRIAGMLSC